MIDYKSIEITNLDLDPNEKKEIYQNLKMIYTTPMGTVSFDRNFGIDLSMIDEPLPIAQGKLMVQYKQKTEKYEPRVNVKEVVFDSSNINGKIVPRVVIERVFNA